MASFSKVKTKDGTVWRFQIAIKGHRESGTRTTKAEAIAYTDERETELRRAIATGVQKDRTVDEAFRRYKTDVSSTKAGGNWEAIRLDALARMEIDGVRFGAMRLFEVTSDTLGKLRDQRLKGVKAAPGVNAVRAVKGSTVNRDFNLLSNVFSTAAKEWKWIAKSPTTDVRRPKEEEARDRLATDDEINRICFALGFALGGEEIAETKSQLVAVMFLFAIETAMRSGEICKLEPAWVDENVVHLPAVVASTGARGTKNGTKRDVPLSTRAVELLTRLPAPTEGGTLFGVTPDSRDALFRKATRRALVQGLTFHDSRHLAITRLSRKLDILALARMVGHRDLRQLQVYYNESAKDIAARIG